MNIFILPLYLNYNLKKIDEAVIDTSWIEAMQEELN